MKKAFLSSLFTLAFFSTGFAVELPNTEGFIELNCSLIQTNMHHHGRHGASHKRMSHNNATDTSTNWSGYTVETNFDHPQANSANSVSGNWVVPSVATSSSDGFSAIWVGLDGFADDTVEQIGTGQDMISGTAQYYAWYEMFPNPSVLIDGFPVEPGDMIGANVTYVGGNTVQLSITNYTQKVTQTFPFVRELGGTERSSAEWIVEAPSEDDVILPLANFGTVHWTECQANLRGHTGSISSHHWQYESLDMVQDDILKAHTSGLHHHGENFHVNWVSAGGTPPG